MGSEASSQTACAGVLPQAWCITKCSNPWVKTSHPEIWRHPWCATCTVDESRKSWDLLPPTWSATGAPGLPLQADAMQLRNVIIRAGHPAFGLNQTWIVDACLRGNTKDIQLVCRPLATIQKQPWGTVHANAVGPTRVLQPSPQDGWMSPVFWRYESLRIAPQTFCRQTCSVWYNYYNTCVESVLSCAMLQRMKTLTESVCRKRSLLCNASKKWKRWLQKDKIYVSWGRYQPISNSLVSSGSNYEAHFTWPVRDGQISPCFKLIRFWPFRRKKLDRPKKNNKWPVKDSRGKGFTSFDAQQT